MKQTSLLKRLRVILAILFFVPIILYFVDFANLLPDSLHGLLHLQIVPAILAGILWIIIAQLLLVWFLEGFIALLFALQVFCRTSLTGFIVSVKRKRMENAGSGIKNP